MMIFRSDLAMEHNQWQHGDRFSAALRLQTGTCAKRWDDQKKVSTG